MHVFRLVLFGLLSSFCVTSVASASIITTLNSESVTFTGIDSNEGLGDATNITQTHTFTGGFNATQIVVEGTLTEVLTGTFASEADIELSMGGTTFLANGSTTTGYTGTLNSPPTTTLLGTPTDFAGTWNMEFFESFSDGAGADQTWDTVTVSIQEVAVVDGNFAIGGLTPDGVQVAGPGQSGNAHHTNVSNGLDFFTFSIGQGLNGANGDWLSIITEDAGTGDTVDSEVFLFDAAGNLVVLDDDGGAGTYSALSFGADTLHPDGGFGSDGATLAAGNYTLVVGGFNTTVGTTIDSLVAGASSGDYNVQFGYFIAVPEPSSAAVLCLFGICALGRRRRS